MSTVTAKPRFARADAQSSAPSRLWKHMAETHNLPLLESEESDIRWACDEAAMRQMAALDAVLVVRDNEIEQLHHALEVAERDAGLYAATLQLTAHHLGCDAHMVDHEVKRRLPNTELTDRTSDRKARGTSA